MVKTNLIQQLINNTPKVIPVTHNKPIANPGGTHEDMAMEIDEINKVIHQLTSTLHHVTQQCKSLTEKLMIPESPTVQNLDVDQNTHSKDFINPDHRAPH